MIDRTPAKTALVVDDAQDVRYAMRNLLEQQRYVVDTAGSAQDAYVYLQRRRPRVIFLSQKMRGCDGLEMLQTLKRDAATASIPIVICSDDAPAFFDHAAAAGAADVLPKPPSAAGIATVLRRLQTGAEATGEVSRGERARVVPEIGPLHDAATHHRSGPAGPIAAAQESTTPPRAARASDHVTALERRVQALTAEVDALRASIERVASEPAVSAEALVPALLSSLEPSLQRRLETQTVELTHRTMARALLKAAEAISKQGRESEARIPDPRNPRNG